MSSHYTDSDLVAQWTQNVRFQPHLWYRVCVLEQDLHASSPGATAPPGDA